MIMEFIKGTIAYLIMLGIIGVSVGIVARIAMFVYLMGICCLLPSPLPKKTHCSLKRSATKRQAIKNPPGKRRVSNFKAGPASL